MTQWGCHAHRTDRFPRPHGSATGTKPFGLDHAKLRNCLVHYRTLWTSDRVLVVDERVSSSDLKQLDDAGDWLALMARSTFRRREGRIVVNVMLPDQIFEHKNKSKDLVPFSYAKKWNMLAASRGFANLVIFPVLMTFTALNDLPLKGVPS